MYRNSCNEQAALVMNKHEKINYIELPSANMQQTKKFFKQVFDWSFEDYGPQYMAFSNAGIDGGFFKSKLKSSIENGAALIVLYSEDIRTTEKNIITAGGIIIKPAFNFHGGRRFHFSEPAGNEFAVWTDVLS